jgi:hypothetical protein
MKNSICLLAFLLIGFNSFSQETLLKINKDTSSQMKTLFKPARLQSFGLSLQSQVLFGKGGPERGMGFQVHLNNKLSLGIASFNSMRGRDGGMQMDPQQRFSAFTMEVTPMANKVFHLSFPLAIGRIQEDAPLRAYPAYVSSSMVMPQPGPGRGMNRNDRRGPGTLGIQPGINLEVNLFKYVKVFGGANYRFAFGEEKTPDMSRAAGTLGVKVGVFDYRKKR